MTCICLCVYAHEQSVPPDLRLLWPLLAVCRVAVPVPRRNIALDHR